MNSQQNSTRIRTTHIGSLPRPRALLDLMKARYAGDPAAADLLDEALSTAVADCVRRQVHCGVDIVTDGEFSKPGFFTYIRERLTGFELRPQAASPPFAREVAAFPEYYEQYFREAMLGGAIVPVTPVACVAPVHYQGESLVQRDIRNLKSAIDALGVAPSCAFLPSTSPSGVGENLYYRTEEEYFHALALAMRTEYRAITDAGFLVQIDDPFLCDIFVDPQLDGPQMRRRAQIYVEAVNSALTGIPEERIRFHTCYGINEGPRLYEAALEDVIGFVLQIHAGQYSFEGANPRHEHEYHLFERVRVPDGKVICPGVISHASNIVEHPQLIAERLLRFARLVGRENVMAGADCGFSSQATYRTEVHPTVVWEKFKALRAGADLASRQLWR